MKKIILLVSLLLVVILFYGCSQKEESPKGTTCTEGSKCKNTNVLAYQNTDCSWASEEICEHGCENNACRIEPRTEIISKTNGIAMSIKPSSDNVVKGIVTITITEFPESTKAVAFSIKGKGTDDSAGPNIGIDVDSSDGFSYIVDTTDYWNGLYTIYSYVFSTTELGEGVEHEGYVSAQVVIQN